MTATELLETLSSRGFVLEVNGDRLRVAPKEGLSNELRTLIAESKGELIQTLKKDHWRCLAVAQWAPDDAETEEEEWFLSAARILRTAPDHIARLTRWHGLKSYLWQHLPKDAMCVLESIFMSAGSTGRRD